MPLFLGQQDLYRLLQRELPPDTYPDGLAQNFYSTSDMWAIAGLLANAYVNLQDIYLNAFPQTTTDRITDWEIKVFGQANNPLLSLSQRVAAVLAKIRSLKGIRVQDMISVAYQVVPASILVEIREWGNYTGGWMIGLSQLGIETFLNAARMVDYTGPGICCPPHAAPANLADMQKQAYTYEVLIYNQGQTQLTTQQLTQLDLLLQVAEPARSTHVITQNLNPVNAIGGST